mgnify:CR=1 FL=1
MQLSTQSIFLKQTPSAEGEIMWMKIRQKDSEIRESVDDALNLRQVRFKTLGKISFPLLNDTLGKIWRNIQIGAPEIEKKGTAHHGHFDGEATIVKCDQLGDVQSPNPVDSEVAKAQVAVPLATVCLLTVVDFQGTQHNSVLVNQFADATFPPRAKPSSHGLAMMPGIPFGGRLHSLIIHDSGSRSLASPLRRCRDALRDIFRGTVQDRATRSGVSDSLRTTRERTSNRHPRTCFRNRRWQPPRMGGGTARRSCVGNSACPDGRLIGKRAGFERLPNHRSPVSDQDSPLSVSGACSEAARRKSGFFGEWLHSNSFFNETAGRLNQLNTPPKARQPF